MQRPQTSVTVTALPTSTPVRGDRRREVHALLLALGVPQMGFTEAPAAAPSAVHAVSIALAAAVMLATLVPP